MDCVRAEDAYTSRLGYEEHIPGQVLPRPALVARLLCTTSRLSLISRELSTGKWKKQVSRQ